MASSSQHSTAPTYIYNTYTTTTTTPIHSTWDCRLEARLEERPDLYVEPRTLRPQATSSPTRQRSRAPCRQPDAPAASLPISRLGRPTPDCKFAHGSGRIPARRRGEVARRVLVEAPAGAVRAVARRVGPHRGRAAVLQPLVCKLQTPLPRRRLAVSACARRDA